MAKPIFILEAPNYITQEQAVHISKVLEKRLPDYNTISFQTKDSVEFNFKVFNAKDFEDIDFKELKEELTKLKSKNYERQKIIKVS